MKKLFFSFVMVMFVMVMGLTLSSLSFPPSSAWAVDVGAKAPEWTLKGQDGKEYKLTDYKGKTIVLEWYNQGCPFVRKHYDSGNMQKLQKTYVEKGAMWFTVVSSAPGKQGHLNPEQAEKVRQEEKSKATAFLLDSDGKVGQAYEAKTTPHMYIIDEKGQLVYQGAIDDHATTEQADISKSRNYVGEALDAHLKGDKIKVAKTKAYGCSVKY